FPHPKSPDRSGGHVPMRQSRTTKMIRTGHAVLFFLALSGAARAQGPPSTIWSSADGAGTLAFSTDGQLLASAGGGTTIFIRQAATGALVRTLTDKSGINSVAFSPDRQLLADVRTNGSSFNLRVYRLADGAVVQMLAGHSNATRSVAFSPL